MKSANKVGRKVKEEGVDEEGENAEGEDRHRQGEKYEHRPEEGVEQSQDNGSGKDGHPVIEGDPRNNMGNHEECRAVYNPFDDELFHCLLLKSTINIA